MEIKRISNQVNLIDEQIQKSQKKLSGPFAQRAKSEIVQKERENLTQLKERKEILGEQLEILK